MFFIYFQKSIKKLQIFLQTNINLYVKLNFLKINNFLNKNLKLFTGYVV